MSRRQQRPKSKRNYTRLYNSLKQEQYKQEQNKKTIINKDAEEEFSALCAQVGQYKNNVEIDKLSISFKQKVTFLVKNPKETLVDNTTYKLSQALQEVIQTILLDSKQVNKQYTDLVHLLELSMSEQDTIVLGRALQQVLRKRRAYKVFLKGILTKAEYVHFSSTGYINTNCMYKFAENAEQLEGTINAKFFGWGNDQDLLDIKLKRETEIFLAKAFTQLDQVLDSQSFYTLRTTKDTDHSKAEAIQSLLLNGDTVQETFPSVITQEQRNIYFKDIEETNL